MKQMLIILVAFSLWINCCFSMTRQQLKNSGKLMKKTCMPKNGVNEDFIAFDSNIYVLDVSNSYSVLEQIGQIEQGKFIEDRNVMCYIACIYTVTQIVKNNKINHEAVIKQVDMMFPQDMKDAVKTAAVHCKDVGKKYKDICEASYWTAKCMYEFDPKNFVFP